MKIRTQDQRSVTDQLLTLVEMATREGLYDAADRIQATLLKRDPSLKRPLFDQDRYTDEANALDREVLEALKPILTKWAETHLVRDIQYVTQHAVLDLCLEHLLRVKFR
jgi:hypothetical protein